MAKTFSNFRLLGLLSVLVLSSCADDQSTLYVALITDIVPGIEFTTLRVELGERQQMQTVRLGDDFLRGVRVAEFDDLPPGEHTGRVVFESNTGDRVAARPFSVEVRPGLQSATVVITRACFGVTCPSAGDPNATACLAGQCVDPRCSQESPEFCPLSDCVADDECMTATAACAEGSCVSGVCLYAGEEGACEEMSYCDPDNGCRPFVEVEVDAGSSDASIDTGTDAGPSDVGTDVPMDAGCECAVGATQSVVCGRGCGRGDRMCGVDCQWQEPACEEPTGAGSCWLWVSSGTNWTSYPEPDGGANEPTQDVVAAFDVEAMGEAYLLTNTSFHVMQISDQTWIASGSLASLLAGLDAPPAFALTIPAAQTTTGRERLELTTTSGARFFFDHQTGTRRWTPAGGDANCCNSMAWTRPNAPDFEDIQAAWFDPTNTTRIYNNTADPLCPAAAGHTGPIAFAAFVSREGPSLHHLESQNCFEFAPPTDAVEDEPFGGLRLGGGFDPRPQATQAAFQHQSTNSVWVITP